MLIQQFNNAVNFATNSYVFVSGIEISKRVADFAVVYIPTIRQCGFFLIGGNDFYKGKDLINDLKQIGSDPEVTRVFWGFVGGTTLLVAGCCGVTASVNSLIHGASSSLDEKLFAVGNGFFFVASIIGLKNNIDDYRSAENRNNEINAIIGIAAHILYIVAATIILSGSIGTVVVVLCCTGTTISLIQALHNFYH
ncbi:MAG: hypothetical protein K940chlam3_00791 [Chlamydiae bacterium]|nr:hypothetical protein [Chlamydiota bacterium]